MSNTIPSPNMNLPVPTVSVDPGPDWATNLDACLSVIDGHNHAPGSGVQINPNGININADLPMNANNLTTVRSVRFSPQLVPLSLAADIGCLYESGVDLYYNDGAGNQVRMTNGGNVAGAAGTITGLPSGTASASFSASTFTFQSATLTPANLNVGPLTIGMNTASSKTVTLTPSAGQAANYTLSLPAAAPTANQVLISDGSGNLTWTRGLMPIGSVIATFPNLAGAYTTAATTAADTSGFVLCGGQTIADASSPMNGAVIPNINSVVFIMGQSSSGAVGGNQNITLISSQLPAHSHTVANVPSTGHTHNMAHVHQWSYSDGALPGQQYTLNVKDTNTVGISGTDTQWMIERQSYTAGGSAYASAVNPLVAANFYTTGVAGNLNTGVGDAAKTGVESSDSTFTTSSVGSGTSISILPPYITAVYLMRIK